MNKYPNDRKYIRVVKPCVVMFRVKADETLNKVPEVWDMVTTNNFSTNGIFFFSNRFLEIDTILELKINFSHSHPSIRCTGKIIRMSRLLDTSAIGLAIEFTKIEEQTRKIISKIVEGVVTGNSHLMARSL